MDNKCIGITLGDLWHTLRRRASWLLLAALLGGIIRRPSVWAAPFITHERRTTGS